MKNTGISLLLRTVTVTGLVFTSHTLAQQIENSLNNRSTSKHHKTKWRNQATWHGDEPIRFHSVPLGIFRSGWISRDSCVAYIRSLTLVKLYCVCRLSGELIIWISIYLSFTQLISRIAFFFLLNVNTQNCFQMTILHTKTCSWSVLNKST